MDIKILHVDDAETKYSRRKMSVMRTKELKKKKKSE